MNITRVGKKLIPAVFAISAITAGNAYANNQIKDSLTLEKAENKTEILSSEKSSNNSDRYSWKNFLLAFGFGAFEGYLFTSILSSPKNKNNEDYDYFGKSFKKDSEKVMNILEGILNNSIEKDFYNIDFFSFKNQTDFFTKKYPTRKIYVDMLFKTIKDTRLNKDQKENLGKYLILKAICSNKDEKLGIDEMYSSFKNKNTYEELVNVVTNSKDNTENSTNKKEKNNNSIALDTVHHKLKFKDVGGQDEAIKILKKNILFPIKYPEFYKDTSINRGFILYGPPGTGKTLLSETLANESDAYFIKLNGNELTSKWIGESEENWRKLFKKAIEKQPSIILIDEFDGIAAKRGNGDVYNDKIVNQILGLISDLEKSDNQVFIIATTNRLDMIDNAILRAGRFGKHIELKAPQNKDEVNQILNIHINKKNYSEDLDIDSFSEELFKENVTGADISSIVSNAYEAAMERNSVYEKMENNTFDNSIIKDLKITSVDLKKAIFDFKNKNKNKNIIGFKK